MKIFQRLFQFKKWRNSTLSRITNIKFSVKVFRKNQTLIKLNSNLKKTPITFLKVPKLI